MKKTHTHTADKNNNFLLTFSNAIKSIINRTLVQLRSTSPFSTSVWPTNCVFAVAENVFWKRIYDILFDVQILSDF